MDESSTANYTHRLRSMMQSVGVASFKALGQAAGVSEWQVQQLRRGQADQMRVIHLLKLSQTLHISLEELLATFSAGSERRSQSSSASAPEKTPQPEAAISDLKQEYHRLQTQLHEQKQALWQEFQQTTLQAIETWLIQYPTAAYAAQQNPQVSAVRLLPLMRPIEQWLAAWGIEAIAPVGTELPFDPQLHQLLEGSAHPGDRVKIRYTGYRQGDKLLYRAKVSPVANGSER
jgi:molecular chaperone GrpE (heat shock protein)